MANHLPVMLCYGADGTTLLSRNHYSYELGGRHLQAVAGSGTEFPVQRCYLNTVPFAAGATMAVLFRPPIPLTKGKSGWHLYPAFRESAPNLRALGHTGISINHYVFDRAVASVRGRRAEQHHELYYKLQEDVPLCCRR